MGPLGDDDRRTFIALIDELPARRLHDILNRFGRLMRVYGKQRFGSTQRPKGVGRAGERGLELADRLESLRVGDRHVVWVQREREETTLIWVAHHQQLFGAWLPHKRLYVCAHPADLRAHQLEQWSREHAVPLVGFLVLEVNQIEDIHRDRKVGAVELFHGVEVELIQHAHRGVLLYETRLLHANPKPTLRLVGAAHCP